MVEHRFEGRPRPLGVAGPGAQDAELEESVGNLVASRIAFDESAHRRLGGGVVAAPVFAEIGLQTARYLGILPSEPLRETFAFDEFVNEEPEGLQDLSP